jgi:hypothetical protein
MSQSSPSGIQTGETPPEWSDVSSLVWERSYRWLDTHGRLHNAIAGLVIGLAWIVISITCCLKQVSLLDNNPAQIFILVCVMLPVTLGGVLMLALGGLPMFLNTSTIRLEDGWLQIHTAPLPWPRTRSILAAGIHMLWVSEEAGEASEPQWGAESWTYYRLTARLSSEDEVLLDNFKDSGPLERAAAELSKVLGL